MKYFNFKAIELSNFLNNWWNFLKYFAISHLVRVHHQYLNFVVLVGCTAVELKLSVRVVTLVVLTHPGYKSKVLWVLHPQRS